jgi:hypothetical protein
MGTAMAFLPHCVLVGVDLSEPSRVALTMAAPLAVHAHASLHVLHAEDPLLCGAARARGIDFSRELRQEIDTFVGTTALPPLDVHRHIVPGPAANVIARACSMGVVIERRVGRGSVAIWMPRRRGRRPCGIRSSCRGLPGERGGAPRSTA